MRTIKAFLKTLVAVRDQPITHLKGGDKLTDDEFRILGNVTADIANAMGEDEFQEMLKKYKVKQ